MEIIAQNNQSLLDISLQVSGSAEDAFNLAVGNDLSITDDLTVGQTFRFTETPINRRVVDYYQSNSIFPATAIMTDTAERSGIFDITFDITFE